MQWVADVINLLSLRNFGRADLVSTGEDRSIDPPRAVTDPEHLRGGGIMDVNKRDAVWACLQV
jgi:hypothetical protein